MTDLADQASEAEEHDRTRAIANATRRSQGQPNCDNCDEPISDLRQSLGATRCIDCQEAYERSLDWRSNR